MKLSIYWKNNGKKEITKYTHVTGIRCGTAAEILGSADADGNGIPRNAPIIQLIMDDGCTATYNADNVGILFDNE